jgi:hypothetical protein
MEGDVERKILFGRSAGGKIFPDEVILIVTLEQLVFRKPGIDINQPASATLDDREAEFQKVWPGAVAPA